MSPSYLLGKRLRRSGDEVLPDRCALRNAWHRQPFSRSLHFPAARGQKLSQAVTSDTDLRRMSRGRGPISGHGRCLRWATTLSVRDRYPGRLPMRGRCTLPWPPSKWCRRSFPEIRHQTSRPSRSPVGKQLLFRRARHREGLRSTSYTPERPAARPRPHRNGAVRPVLRASCGLPVLLQLFSPVRVSFLFLYLDDSIIVRFFELSRSPAAVLSQ